MLKKLFLYIFCPKWIIYKSEEAIIKSSYYLNGIYKISGTEHISNITFNIMYSKNRNKYKLQILGLGNLTGIECSQTWQQLTNEVYKLNHSK